MNNKTLVLLTIATIFGLISATSMPKQQRCQALALQAGGDLGGFEIGALKGMLAALPAEQLQYDVVSGISVGSINALGIAQFPKGEEQAMVQQMIQFWTDVEQNQIFSNYKGGLAQGLIFEKGLFDTQNERILLTKNVKVAPQRKMSVGTTNLKTGNLDRYDENQSMPDLIESVMCSSAFPGVFPYQDFHDEIYADGGTVQLVDVPGAVSKCREIVDDDSLIDLDIIFVQHATDIEDWEGNLKKKTLQVIQRAKLISDFSSTYREFIEAKMLFPNVNFRHVIKPSKALPNAKFPFAFNQAQIQSMILQGEQDAINIINGKEGSNKNTVNTEEQYEAEAYENYLKDLKQSVTPQNKEKLQNFFKNSMSAYEKLKKSL